MPRLAIFAAGVFLATTPASADEARLPASVVDGGRITMQELAAHRNAVFHALDTNNDALVTEEEFTAFPLPRNAAFTPRDRSDLFPFLDSDDDGQINVGEWTVAVDKAVQLTDTDGDGYVSLAEIAEMHRSDTLDEAVPPDLLLDGLVDSLF